MKFKIKPLIASAFMISVLILLLLSAEESGNACRAALELCGKQIIPSLFPFFILSNMLNRMGLSGILGSLLSPFVSRIYGISGAGASALIVGLTGGYPSGAAYIAEMERSGTITASEGERLIGFCNNSGPAFIIGAVGIGVFRSVKIGLILYAVHIFSALITGLFFRSRSFCAELPPVLLDSTDPREALSYAVKQSVSATLNVCGFVLCFSVITAILDSRGYVSVLCGYFSDIFGWELHFSRTLLCGILELGNGVGAMTGLSGKPIDLALSAGLLGFGGISVYFQTLSVLSDSKIKGALHIAGHLISASIAAVTAYIIGALSV